MTSRVYVDPRMLDRRLRVERRTEGRDASGGLTVVWTLVSTQWAGVKAKGGDKLPAIQAHGGDVADATHEVTMHYLAGLSPTGHRLRDASAGTVYEIVAVDDVFDQHVKMVLLCKTGATDG